MAAASSGLLPCMALLLWLSTASAGDLPAPLTEPFPDQFGNPVTLPADRDVPLLIIIVDARKAKHIERWERALRKQYPELLSARVADVTGLPPPTMTQVSTKLRQHAPDEVSIMIDLENRWADAFDLDTREPCLLLLDPSNKLTLTLRGRANKKNVRTVMAVLQPESSASSPEAVSAP